MSSRKPLIGHNLMYDLLFAYAHFHEPLPPAASLFKRELHALFPTVFDTKLLAQAITALDLKAGPDGSGITAASYKETGVESLYTKLTAENKAKPKPTAITLCADAQYQRYREGAAAVYHEAAFGMWPPDSIACGALMPCVGGCVWLGVVLDAYYTGVVFILLRDRFCCATGCGALG